MFAGGRKQVYTKADDASASRDERLNRLKNELRDHIRFLSDYEPLSADWLRMAESLHQIANVAFMETHLPPAEENPLNQAGKKARGTLWDQERDEIAVRILLEEGKLNLALRILHRYKVKTREANFDSQLQQIADRFKSDLHSVRERVRVFEQSVGILLKFAFRHVEALQIVDLPEFFDHCKEILKEAIASEEKSMESQSQSGEVEKLQETLIIHYFESLSSELEELDEDRVMDYIEQHELMALLIQQFHKHYQWYRVETLEAFVRAMNGFFHSEAFQSEKARFMSSETLKRQLCDLKGFFIGELVTGFGMQKKEIQTLLDEIARYERVYGVSPVVPLTIKKTQTSALAAPQATGSLASVTAALQEKKDAKK